MSTVIGEVTASREVQAVMRHGAGDAHTRALVAVGLIEHRVRRAFGIPDDVPLDVPEIDVAAHVAIIERHGAEMGDLA